MKRVILLIFILSNNFAFSQILKLVDSPIKVNIKGYIYDYLNKNRKKKSWRQTIKVEFWFNKNGLLLQTRFWGKHHNTNLKLLNKITQNTYDSNDLRILSQEWENSYSDSIEISFKTIYSYNKHKQLSKIQAFEPTSDFPFVSTEFTYDHNNGKNLLTTTQGTTKYVYEYDSLNRLKYRKQFFGTNFEKLNWIESYYNNNDTSMFITNVYHGDSIIKYTQKNTTIYNLKQQSIVNIDEYLPPNTSFSNKSEYFYNQKGLIKLIRTYRKFSSQNDFVLTSTIKYDYKLKTAIDSKSVKKINEKLINFDSEN